MFYWIDPGSPGFVFCALEESKIEAYRNDGGDAIVITQDRAVEYLQKGHPNVPDEGLWSLVWR